MNATKSASPQLPRAFTLRMLVIVGLGLVVLGWLFSQQPMPQNPSYHQFADQRTLLGIPHLLNVISNVPFVLIGLLGLRFLWRKDVVRPGGPFREPGERWPFVLLFLGVGLTGFGSAYYHLEPTNERLVWDRLPMALAFTSFFASILGERIGPKIGLRLLLPFVAVGIASVVYWHWTEKQGRGDLRPYYFVQFFPILAIPLMLLLFPPSYTRTTDLFIALGWYVLAKVCEDPFDGAIFAQGGWVSGHTLKHLAAAAGAYWILRMLQARQPVGLACNIEVSTSKSANAF
jgi:hypothetical protein